VDQKAVANARERQAVRLVNPTAHGARIAVDLFRKRGKVHKVVKEIV
jgi:hypothetical protein